MNKESFTNEIINILDRHGKIKNKEGLTEAFPEIYAVFDKAVEEDRESFCNWLAWWAQFAHADHSQEDAISFSDCGLNVCTSVRETIAELRKGRDPA